MQHISTFRDLLVYNIIYSFHVPLFFAIAGYFAYNKDNSFQKKTLSLLIPFLFFVIVGLIRQIGFGSLTFLECLDQIFVMDWWFWFLPVLWWCFVIIGMRRQGIMLYVVFFFFPLVMYSLDIPHFNNFFGVGYTSWYFIFFFGGFILSKYQYFLESKKWYFIVVSLIGYVVFMSLTKWSVWNGTAIDANTPVIAFKYDSLGLFKFVALTMQAVFGIGVCVGLAMLLSKVKWVSLKISWIGGMTLGIYLIHLWFARYGWGEGWIKVLTSFVLSLTIGIVTTWFIRKWKWSDMVILGNISRIEKKVVLE